MKIIEIAIGYVGSVVVSYVVSYVIHHVVKRIGGETMVKVYDGQVIAAVSGDVGAPLVYQEMYQQQVYLQHGLKLQGIKDPVVVDAGVNIGIFSRFCAEKFPTARVYGAEPIDVIADLARKNTSQYKDRVKIATVGLGKATGEMTIEYRPTLSSASTMHPAEVASVASKDALDWLRGLLLDGIRGGKFPSFPLTLICSLLAVPYLRVLITILLSPLLGLAGAWYTAAEMPKRNIKCRIITMETLLKELGAPATGPIHFLKIDVEGAELDVLEGISDSLWDRVQQVVVETHNIDNRVERVRKLLTSKGFPKVVSDKEEWEVHRLLDITSLYATKL